MSHRRSNRPWRTDAAVVAAEDDIALMRAVAAGRVVRGAGAELGINAPHLMDGQPVRLQLRRLAAEDLVTMPISGPPSIAPRGRLVLELANGEIAAPLPDP